MKNQMKSFIPAVSAAYQNNKTARLKKVLGDV